MIFLKIFKIIQRVIKWYAKGIKDYERKSRYRCHRYFLIVILISTAFYPFHIYSKFNKEKLNTTNFSMLAKHIFVKYQDLQLNTTWHKNLYMDYLQALGMTTNEDLEKRISLLTNDKKHCDSIETHYSAAFLEERGMQRRYLDQMAYEYVKQKGNTYIVVLFPPTSSMPDKALSTLLKYGTIVYTKPIILKRNGFYNLLSALYEVHHADGWPATLQGVYNRFNRILQDLLPKKIIAVLWESTSLKRAIDCKREIRALYKDVNACHFNDKRFETLYLAKTVFNQNTLDFLNGAYPKHFMKFVRHIKRFQSILKKLPELEEAYCIDAGAVLSAYGLRDCHDLDLIIKDANHPILRIKDLGCNNVTRKKYDFNIDDLIYNPDNFFYHKGLRFLTLEAVLEYKKRKGNTKDLNDLKIIGYYLQSVNR